jgi:hypothetical protein
LRDRDSVPIGAKDSDPNEEPNELMAWPRNSTARSDVTLIAPRHPRTPPVTSASFRMTSAVPAATGTPRTGAYAVGVALLLAGAAGHFFAARAIGGTRIAYRDHMGGFLLLSVIGALFLGSGQRILWRGRQDITLLLNGAAQLAIGIYAYVNRFDFHG